MRNVSIILALLIALHLNAVTSIQGKVVDSQNNPLPYVSVVLQNVQDSSYVCGVATDTEGLFTLQIQEDIEYTLLLSYMGYETIKKVCKAGNLGTIVMKEDSKMLDEVVIVASRTQYDARGYMVNLRSSAIAKGKQAPDALAFLPGVSKEDGDYKINGLKVSEIYVDGVKLTSSDELKNIPADIIDKVKVNYLAGANQNAANAGGTIEITLHKKVVITGHCGVVLNIILHTVSATKTSVA